MKLAYNVTQFGGTITGWVQTDPTSSNDQKAPLSPAWRTRLAATLPALPARGPERVSRKTKNRSRDLSEA